MTAPSLVFLDRLRFGGVMSARRAPRAIAPVMVSTAFLAFAGCARSAPAPPPSILLVTFDTMRADHVGCYGSREAETPNLDRLAAEGMRFDEARSHVPLTLPSHTTILTGLLPPHHGVRGNGSFHLAADIPTLASVLRRQGYATAAVVSSVVLDRVYGLDRGFDSYDDNQRVGEKRAFNYLERGADQVADAVRRQLPLLKPPFFVWVHLFDPHRPWVAPAAFASRHPGRPYDAEIAFADAAFGDVRQAAEARAGGSLVVLALADHGESLGYHGESRHGYTLHRGVLRVPLIIAGAGIPRARVVPATVGLVDVAPTIAELAGASLPGADGVSLRRFWADAAAATSTRDREPLWEETLHPLYESGWAPLRGIVTDTWHLVDAPRPELYARHSDPDDGSDVASSNGTVVHELRSTLAELGQAMGDVPEPQPEVRDDPDERERLAKLAALGYLSAGSGRERSGPRLDPKDGLPGFVAMEEAEVLFKQGRLGEALDLLHPFTKKDPENPRLWNAQGMILFAMGRQAEAQSVLERAIALDPRSEAIRFAYSDVLRARGDLAGSRAQLEDILRENPRMVEATLFLAASFEALGDAGRAESVLVASYDAGVRDPDVLLRLGAHLERSGSHDAAAKRFLEVLDLRPDDAEALLATGRAALRAAEPTRAIEYLTRCTDGPKALPCRIELARALATGPRDLARARSVLLGARGLARTAAERFDVEERLRALENAKNAR